MKDGTHSPPTRLKRWRHPALTITLTFVALAGIGLGAYHTFSQSSQNPKRPIETNTKTAAANAVQITSNQGVSSNTYSDWQTSSLSKYSVKFPHGWYDIRREQDKAMYPDQITFSNENITYPMTIQSKDGVVVNVSLIAGDKLPEIESRVFASPNGAIDTSDMLGAGIITKLSDMNISGNPTVSFSQDFSSDPSLVANYSLYYVINRNGTYYELSASMNKSMATTYAETLRNIVESISIK